MAENRDRRCNHGVRATYRVQFNQGFTFADAARLAGYFGRLGISHLYASPIFAARRGSTHGYDMVDPTRISEELGGEAGFRAMAAALAEEGIGIVLDIVPNHMAADAANPFWMDVLEFGASSASAPLFDIDFTQKIALPWLTEGDDAIDHLAYDAALGRVAAVVAGNPVPLRPASVARLLDGIGAVEAAEAWRTLDDGSGDPDAVEAARRLLRAEADAAPGAFERALCQADRDAIHASQHWQAVPWRRIEAINYRRFFEVTHLLGVRIEDEAVFDLVHRLPLALVSEGLVQGLRVDHIDGLADPAGYADRLRSAAGPDTLLLIEKILGRDEDLRPWPIDGTTGYERLGLVNEAFVSAGGRDRLARHLESRGLIEGTAEARIFAAKTEVLEASFKPELARLAVSAADLLEDDPPPRSVLDKALLSLLAGFPVYRSYIAAIPADPADVALWTEAGRRAALHAPATGAVAARLVEAALRQTSTKAARFRQLFQQLSGPAMAKGFEDTELYRSVALTSMNEVGADIAHPPRDAAALHAAFARFSAGGLTPLATHDTKRGADTRARLNLISHHAEAWIGLTGAWRARHAAFRPAAGPDPLDEWLIYQTLFGAWPISTERAHAYFEKAMREAKRHSFWTDPADDYESAVKGFVTILIEGDEGALFRRELESFVAAMAPAARVNSLAQTILQLTLPGIPDLYRGTELYDFSLVDPDNRRPVDWERRCALQGTGRIAIGADDEGVSKLAAIQALLALRKNDPGLFEAPYQPLDASGGWLAFVRSAASSEMLVAVPLTPDAVRADGLDLAGRNGVWRDVIGGSTARIEADRLAIDAASPVVVLTRATVGARAEPLRLG